jgi:hypothetical protein
MFNTHGSIILFLFFAIITVIDYFKSGKYRHSRSVEKILLILTVLSGINLIYVAFIK